VAGKAEVTLWCCRDLRWRALLKVQEQLDQRRRQLQRTVAMQVMRFAVTAAYAGRLEASYLAEEVMVALAAAGEEGECELILS
jgi:hypothetical protein